MTECAYTNDEIAELEGLRASIKAIDDAPVERYRTALAVLRGAPAQGSAPSSAGSARPERRFLIDALDALEAIDSEITLTGHLKELVDCALAARNADFGVGYGNGFEDQQKEIDRLRERLGPCGLEVVEINGAGHYVNEKVKAEIDRLRALPQTAQHPSTPQAGEQRCAECWCENGGADCKWIKGPQAGVREALDSLADKVAAKVQQLEHYRDNESQLDHAKIIAEGRIQQANQILHWIAETAVSHVHSGQTHETKAIWRGKSPDEIFDIGHDLGWDGAVEKCAEIADSYAKPNRFKVSDAWKEDQSPADVYETAAVDVSNWIEKEILALKSPSNSPGATETEGGR